MSITDPIADMLTRLRNANAARHEPGRDADRPSSRSSRPDLLEREGYIEASPWRRRARTRPLTVMLKYSDDRQRVISGIKRISKPGRRIYAERTGCPRSWAALAPPSCPPRPA